MPELETPHPLDRLDERAYALADEDVRTLQTPALVIHLDRVRENVARVVTLVGGDPGRWRPHVKTAKVPVVMAEMVRAGLRHFKTATTLETAALLRAFEDEGVSDGDVVFAHHAYGPALERLDRLAAAHPGARLSILCEDPARVQVIPADLGVVADVNPGMNRTGIPDDREAEIVSIAERAGGRFRGIHFYDGHLHIADVERRGREAIACYDRLMELAALLSARGVEVPELMTSGTPTFLDAIGYAPFDAPGGTIHRVSPGTVVYDDARTEEDVPGLGLVPAAVVLARVVSHPAEDIVTCDAGSKSLATDYGDPCAHVVGHRGLEALRPSEEHLPLRVTSGTPPESGRPLSLVPRHVCPTVNLANEAVLVEGGVVRDVVPVAARGHERPR